MNYRRIAYVLPLALVFLLAFSGTMDDPSCSTPDAPPYPPPATVAPPTPYPEPPDITRLPPTDSAPPGTPTNTAPPPLPPHGRIPTRTPRVRAELPAELPQTGLGFVEQMGIGGILGIAALAVHFIRRHHGR